MYLNGLDWETVPSCRHSIAFLMHKWSIWLFRGGKKEISFFSGDLIGLETWDLRLVSPIATCNWRLSSARVTGLSWPELAPASDSEWRRRDWGLMSRLTSVRRPVSSDQGKHHGQVGGSKFSVDIIIYIFILLYNIIYITCLSFVLTGCLVWACLSWVSDISVSKLL